MYKIKSELLQTVANYLASRPFAEVFQIIQELQKLEKIEEAPSEEKKV